MTLDEARDGFYAACAGLETAILRRGWSHGVSTDARERWIGAWLEYEAVCVRLMECGEDEGLLEHERVLGSCKVESEILGALKTRRSQLTGA